MDLLSFYDVFMYLYKDITGRRTIQLKHDVRNVFQHIPATLKVYKQKTA